jgi:4-carboxymuconolactone decarboxylase
MPKNPDFGTFGRYQELLVEEMSPSQKKAYEYTMKERGQVPGPYKIWLQNPDLIEVMVPLGAYYQGHSSLSKAEIEIAAIVWRRAEFNA